MPFSPPPPPPPPPSSPPPPCKTGDGTCCCPPQYSNSPVQYANGTAPVSGDEVMPSRKSRSFGHKRRYSNQRSGSYSGIHGYNWWASQLPYASSPGTNIVAITFNSDLTYWFDKVGSTYVPRYAFLNVSLVEDTIAETFTFADASDGQTETTLFNSLAAPTNPGAYLSNIDSGGVQTTATITSGQITETQRSYTVGVVTIIESILYAYFTSGSATGLLQTVTYRTQVGGGSWTPIEQGTYAYFGPSDPNGSLNDLQSASQQLPDGLGGWNTIGVDYYRYWLSGSTTGFAHAMKMHFGPEAYRLMFNAGIDLSTASDATVLPYADHYFEYDPTAQVVTKEISAVCASCPGGGTTADLFSYSTNGHYPGDGFGTWKTKTVQTLPDSSQIVVYSSYAGIPILRVQIDPTGSNMWGTFYRYDSNGQVIWVAQPSAVALPASLATLEAYDDLLNYSGGSYAYLNNSTGLINVTGYDGNMNVISQAVRNGQAGSDIPVASFTYVSNTDANGITIYLPATSVAYPDASDPSITITTSFAYTFYSGTNQISQRTTTLPVVSTAQNGSNVADTIVEQYDSYGNRTQFKDERGIINNYTWDVVRSRMTQQVLNYQSGVTAPGVNVTTDFTYDDLGRPTSSIGPSHTVVIGGTATAVQPVTWSVYNQSAMPGSGMWDVDSTWTGNGYFDGTNYTLVNPVTLGNMDKDGRSTDVIASVRTTGSGALSASDTFAQTDWQNWNSTQYDEQHRTISSRVYHDIPASGLGTIITNYGETDFGYDALERQNRLVAPGGTITRTVWTCPQWVLSTWVGTNDTGATDADPTGGGAAGNNMVQITLNQWDGGSAGGDGNLTQQTQYVSATSGDTRVTAFGYDFRDRRTSVTDATNRYALTTLDNLGRPTMRQRYATLGGNLISQTAANWDDRSRVYQSIVYAVDPSTGSIGNALTGNMWYDPSGNTLQQIAPGAGKVFTKAEYNGVNWVTASYIGYNTSGYSYTQAGTVSGDIIVEQKQDTFDEVGNTIAVASFQRLNDTSPTATGALGYTSAAYASAVAAFPAGTGSSAPDASGKGNNATLSSSGVSWASGGPTGAYLSFDSSQNGQVQAPDAASLRLTGDLTLAAWINPTDFSTYRALFSKVTATSPYPNPYDSYLGTPTGVPSLSLGNGLPYPGSEGFGGTAAPPTATWSHFAVTVTGTAGAFYQDGVPNGTFGVGVTPADGGQPLNIGLRNGGGVAWYGGLADLRLYNRGLSQAEIAGLYNLSPAARVSYVAYWFDGIDRQIATANYGAIDSFTRATTPPSSSATVLVNEMSYDSASRVYQTTDPKGIIAQNGYDNANRKIQMIEDVGGIARTTNFTFTLDNLVATMTAVNSSTGDQTTTYLYGTTLADSGVARNDLLSMTTYPDTRDGWADLSVDDWATLSVNDWSTLAVNPFDSTASTYNRLGQQLTFTDQRNTRRTFLYDKLGRQTDDCVTTVGVSTDSAVLRISTAYEIRGMVNLVTSYDNATPGSGTVLNQVAMTFNSFAQLTKDQQDHAGAVSGSSSSVQYAYDAGGSSSNEIRFTTLTYPNGRIITNYFGTSGGMNDLLNRVDKIQDTTSGTTDLAGYTYLGLGTVVKIDYPEPQVNLDLWGGTSGTFSGFDLFGRIINQPWYNYNTSTMLDQYQYGYDQNSNRQWKANPVSAAAGVPLDEYYINDSLNRLTDMQRGTLSGGKTGITGTPTIEQNWTLDPTGNWSNFLTKASGTTDLNQTRTSNPVNEITNITESTGPTWIVPAYDPAGNTTIMPQTADPTQEYLAVYDAWKRMVKISDSSYTVAKYQLDGFGRRIVRFGYTSGVLSETRHFYFAKGNRDIEQRVGSAISMDQQHVRGIRYINELVCRDDATPQRLYVGQDANFNVTALVSAIGSVVERVTYDPYGIMAVKGASWSATSDAYSLRYRYQGGLYDLSTGQTHFGARDLGSGIGAWIQRDVKYVDAPGLYEFVGGNAISRLDPLGHWWVFARYGSIAHLWIEAEYQAAFPGHKVFTDRWLKTIAEERGGNVAVLKSLKCERLRPDIFDATTQDLWEIKSDKMPGAAALAELEALLYIWLLRVSGVQSHLGNNPKILHKSGTILGVLRWRSPQEGVILYRFQIPKLKPRVPVVVRQPCPVQVPASAAVPQAATNGGSSTMATVVKVAAGTGISASMAAAARAAPLVPQLQAEAAAADAAADATVFEATVGIDALEGLEALEIFGL